MPFFNIKIFGDRRSGKVRRKSRFGPKGRVERRSGTERRMSLYDRLPEGQRNTVETIIRHLERQVA